MEAGDSPRVVPFQLQLDKPLASQVKIAAWNPEKDLLAMVTEDSKLHLHRFNWQRLWTASPAKHITSICWRPDGKAIAVGLDDGAISLHDVENGKLLRCLKSHAVSVSCLNWVEDGKQSMDANDVTPAYEDRTARFFPPAPRAPRTPGLVAVDSSSLMDENDDSFWELFNASHGQFDILCSGDIGGNVHLHIFGIFPIGRVNIHSQDFNNSLMRNKFSCTLENASISKVALSDDRCHINVLFSGTLIAADHEPFEGERATSDLHGFHSMLLDCTIFKNRKNELHQVAQQAVNVEHLIEVIWKSIKTMSKQWSDAMNVYNEKFNSLGNLISDHGIESSPEEEFLSLLCGARTSPAVHQFLVNSLGEAGVKRVAKVVCGAGKELQTIVLDHIQPAAEMIAFRLGELRGLSKWRARFHGVGLDENLINAATEEAGMLLLQIERFIKILSSVVRQFSNFFNWLLKCVKVLMSEPSDQLQPFNSELVILFLKFLYNQDLVGLLLRDFEFDQDTEFDPETKQHVDELVRFGGFQDTGFVRRTLTKEFTQLQNCFKEALEKPLATVSGSILCQDILPLFSVPSSSDSNSSYFSASISYFREAANPRRKLIDYISFMVPDGAFPDAKNCIGIVRRLPCVVENSKNGHSPLEFALLRAPDGYQFVDLSLYKEEKLVLLLNEVDSENSGNSCMMILQAVDFAFVPVTRTSDCGGVHLRLENEKLRRIPHEVVAPLAVSSSRGVGCVFTARKRALVYILEEDEDEVVE
ncbi:hypothetical protein M569_01601, partial [Genlisea aurea]